jgi:TonB-dependent Receptor Plug Domain
MKLTPLTRSIWLFTLLLPCFAHSQDSLLLRKEVATVFDLNALAQDKTLRSSLATGESLELGVTPYTVYIISSEDILRQNISTLTDVMRLIPGSVVTQSGSAQEGEKWMVDGLSGNAHMKIMVNNVPVKPWAAPGMPIGAQLPIRQADRIEVMLGSSSSFYGEEACAGVINIILEESERPVFTRTNLGFGRLGYNDIDLTFGGKLGGGRDVFRFTVYGRSTIQSTRDIFYDKQNLYNYRDYLLYPNLTAVWERNPNLVLAAAGDSVIAVGAAPHESRQFGVMLLWRGIRVQYNLMNRRDYSSIGLNPMAASYRRAGDRVGERIETLSLQFGRERKRRQSNLLFSALSYTSTENSLKTHVFGAMGQTYFHNLRKDVLPNFNEKLYNRLFDTYYSGQRNVVSQGFDMRAQYRVSFALRRGFTYSTGVMSALTFGNLSSDLFSRPSFSDVFVQSTDTLGPLKPFPARLTVALIPNHYHQLLYRKNRLTLMAGISGHYVVESGLFLQKRGAAFWRLNRLLSFDANYGEGFTPVSPWYAGHTVGITTDESSTFQLEEFRTDYKVFQTAKTHTYEAGIRGQLDHLSGRVGIMRLRQTGSMEGGYTESGNDRYGSSIPFVLYGYRNDAGSATKLNVVRMEARLDSSLLEFGNTSCLWSQMVNVQLSKGQRTGVADTAGVRRTLDAIPNYPGWNFKYGSMLVTRKLDISMIVQWQSATTTHLGLYQHRYPRLANRSNQARARRTVDLSARWFINKNFSAWVDLRNLFDRSYDGIDATGTPDDLIYNQQAGRVLRFGMQYNLD